jgi:hypothetical protein
MPDIIPFPNESRFEAATIDRLRLLGYEYANGRELREHPDFSLELVVHTDALRRHLRLRPHARLFAPQVAVGRSAGQGCGKADCGNGLIVVGLTQRGVDDE